MSITKITYEAKESRLSKSEVFLAGEISHERVFSLSGNQEVPEYFDFEISLKGYVNLEAGIEILNTVSKVKDLLFLRGIDNLIRKGNFLKLYIELLQEQITEDEFEKEIENKPEDYIIETTPMESAIEFHYLAEILKNFPKKNISLDDFADIFGVSSSNILELQSK